MIPTGWWQHHPRQPPQGNDNDNDDDDNDDNDDDYSCNSVNF